MQNKTSGRLTAVGIRCHTSQFLFRLYHHTKSYNSCVYFKNTKAVKSHPYSNKQTS